MNIEHWREEMRDSCGNLIGWATPQGMEYPVDLPIVAPELTQCEICKQQCSSVGALIMHVRKHHHCGEAL